MKIIVSNIKRVWRVRNLRIRLNNIKELNSLYQSLDIDLSIKKEKHKSKRKIRPKRPLRVAKKTNNNLFICYPHFTDTKFPLINSPIRGNKSMQYNKNIPHLKFGLN